MRNTITRMGVVLATLAAATAGLVAAGPAQAGSPGKQAKPLLLIYGSDDFGVQITRPSQVVHHLGGAPESFQAFVRAEVRHLREVDHCDPAAIGFGINRVRTDGFAAGGVNDCGGYQAIWRQVDGRWREVLGTQDIWACSDLRRNDIPASILRPHAKCLQGRDVIAYHHG